MAKSPRIYQRLTRRTSSLGSYNSLWLAKDHLLILKSTGYTEEYLRLYFRDIKGVFIIGSERRLYWALFWCAGAILSGVWAWFTYREHETPVFSSIFLAIFAGAIVWNHLMGAGSVAFVVTGVQTARLPSLVRLPKAHKVLARITPLIEAAQVDLAKAPAAFAEPVPPPLG